MTGFPDIGGIAVSDHRTAARCRSTVSAGQLMVSCIRTVERLNTLAGTNSADRNTAGQDHTVSYYTRAYKVPTNLLSVHMLLLSVTLQLV